MIKKERLARQVVESVVSTEPIEPDRSMYEILFMDYLNVLSDDTEKQIVSLRILNDMQHKTIAKILDIPESTIRWKYKQALKKIKSSLKGDTNEK
jgi:RNA polymerase sigma-70 factor (ECF subfamily)